MRTDDPLDLAPYYEARGRVLIALGQLRDFAKLRNRREHQWARLNPIWMEPGKYWNGAIFNRRGWISRQGFWGPDIVRDELETFRRRRRAVCSKNEHTQRFQGALA